jgi:hypothetical protein
MCTNSKIERQEFDEASGTYAGAYVDLGSFYGTQANATLLLANTTYRFRVSAGETAKCCMYQAKNKWPMLII